MKKTFYGIIFTAIVPVLLVGFLQADAGGPAPPPFFLFDDNSIVAISLDSQLGTFFWSVDGQNQIFQQWFWFRINDEGKETSLNKLELVNVEEKDDNMLISNFTDANMKIDVVWELVGGSEGSNQAEIIETIEITNINDENLEMHFFQYTDFDVDGPFNNTVQIFPPNIAVQSNGPIAETVVSPDPARFQVGEVTEDDNIILRSLNDDKITELNNTAGPIPAEEEEEGVDGNWAFQWDIVIPAGESFTIEKNKKFFIQTLAASGSSTWEPPTIGPDRKGVSQVKDGICINVSCWTVTQDYHVDFELYEMLTGKNTISLEILCPHGVNDCNYVAIGITKPGDTVNAPIWSIAIAKNHLGQWTEKISDPEGRLGEITYTIQVIDNYRLGVSFTIDFKNKPTDNSWLWVQLRDFNHGIRNFYFNEGIKFVDSDAYPTIKTAYEKPIKVEPLCINENSNHRNSCAFEKVRSWTTQNAQNTLDKILDRSYVYN